MQKVLKPIYDKESYHNPIADEIMRELYNIIFAPIFDILNVKHPKVNSLADLKAAFRAGRIYWNEGYIYGNFNSVVGKSLRAIGASFVPSKKAYKLDLDSVPMDIRTDIVIGRGMNRSKTEAVLKHLDGIDKAVLGIRIGSGKLGDPSYFDTILADLNKQVIKTFDVVSKDVEVPFDITDKTKKALTEEYTENMNLYIQGWAEEEIERLRAKTEANAILGYRADRLAEIVKSEYGVSKSKAAFLARQETSLFVSKYREERYTNAGVKEYVWSTSHDERVRHDHAELNGQKFSWDMPPITDRRTGKRNNPGEDFGCRCLALPVVNIRAE